MLVFVSGQMFRVICDRTNQKFCPNRNNVLGKAEASRLGHRPGLQLLPCVLAYRNLQCLRACLVTCFQHFKCVLQHLNLNEMTVT